MERLRRELEAFLREQYPDGQIDLEPVRPRTKLSGIIAWAGFDGLEPIDRQMMLWRAIRSRFDREDQLRISGLIALTPAEYAASREPQMA